MDLARILTSLLLAAACRSSPAERRPPDEPAGEVPPAAPAEVRAAAPGEPVLGTEHPFVFVAADPDARWTALCQARADTDGNGEIRVQAGQHGDTYGDRLDTYLILGEGPGEAIDDLVDVDEHGDRLLLVLDGRLVLFTLADARREAITDALVDARRAGALDRAGRRLAYRKPRGARELVVVRDLASGAEIEVDPGRGLLYDFAFVGEWLELVVVPRDSDGDRELRPAWTFRSRSDLACPGPLGARGSFVDPGDRTERRYVPATGGAPTPISDVIAPLGAVLLARTSSGAIVAHGLDGQRDTWVPAACAGHVLALAPEGPRALVACTGRPRARVAIYGPGLEHPLAGHPVLDPFASSIPAGRLAAYATSQDLRLVDLAALTEQALPPGHTFVAASDRHVLLAALEPRGALSLFDPGTGTQRTVALDTLPSNHLRQGPLVSVRPVLVDLDRGALVGVFDGAPLALARDGRLLLPRRPPPKDPWRELPVGPLVWRTPRPA